MNELAQFTLLIAALIYFWTVMFETFSRSCAAIGGVILIGCAGMALKPAEQEGFYEMIALLGFTALLLARSWLIWKEWYHGE